MRLNGFGSSNEKLSALGLGCSRIGSFNNPASSRDIKSTIDQAIDLGINVFDTADIYGQGDSETALGRFLGSRRDRAFVVSKVGQRFSLSMRAIRPLKPFVRPLIRRLTKAREVVSDRRADNIRSDFSPDYLTRAIDGSLRRLKFEMLDAVLLHSPGAADLTRWDIEPALINARNAGKIRHYGISCDDLPSLTQAMTFAGITLLELPVDVIDGARTSAVWNDIKRRNIGVLAREAIRLQPGLAPYDAIARTLSIDGVTCVVAGTSRPAHLVELARAV